MLATIATLFCCLIPTAGDYSYLFLLSITHHWVLQLPFRAACYPMLGTIATLSCCLIPNAGDYSYLFLLSITHHWVL